jgi:hypothetical protein
MVKHQFCLRSLIFIIAIIGLVSWTLEASPVSSAIPADREIGSTGSIGGNTGIEKNVRGRLLQQEIHRSAVYHRGDRQYDILLLVSDVDQPVLRSTLAGFSDINAVDHFDATYATPTLAQLLSYDAVLCWPNYLPFDSVALGDTLAAYVDRGGAVVCCGFCWYLNGNYFAGEIMSASYNPFFGQGGNHLAFANLGWYNASHPIMNGVSAVSDKYRDYLTLNDGVLGGSGADTVAKWDDGEWFVAAMGRVVAVNAVPGDGYGWTGDLITLCHNALIWAIERPAPQCIIFQDNNPWDYTWNQGLLNANGRPYRVYGSADIGVIDLSPYDKVIIASVQPLAFYNTVASNRTWFENYVNAGGVLEFHGASYFPSDDWAGLTMPGNFTCADEDVSFSDSVSIQAPGHPIVTTPNSITDGELDGWGWSTHGYLILSGPPYTEILRNDGYSEPCLVEFSLGSGEIIATMNTLEWGFDNAPSQLLENVLLYMLPPGVEEESGVPTSWTSHVLAQSRPNPFAIMTTIDYSLSSPGSASLKIFDISGRLVKTLVKGVENEGEHSVTWDGRDGTGREVANGVYFYQLTVGNFNSTKTLVVLR